MNFRERAKDYHDPETMAKDYLALYFGNDKIEYPIDPFKMLKDEGIFFALSDFKKIEGIYIPASTDDIPLVDTICLSARLRIKQDELHYCFIQ